MEDLKLKRGHVKRALTRFERAVNAENPDLPALKVSLDRNLSLIDQFNDIQNKIEELCDNDEQFTIEEEAHRESFENRYDKAVGNARNLIARAEQPHKTLISSTDSNSIRENNEENNGSVLKRIDIPKFNGGLSKWVKFRDTYNSLVHNNAKLSNIQKFTYLEDALVGKAKSAIASLGVSDENYASAWAKVKSRFEDIKELKQHHLSNIFEASILKRNSSEELRELIDTFDNNLSALKTLKEPIDTWDAPMSYILCRKLSVTVRIEWEKTDVAKSGDATLRDLIQFLEEHCKFLSKKINERPCVVESHHVPKIMQTKHVNASKTYVITNNRSCLICNATHPVYACGKFRQLSPQMRLEKVHKAKICKNCLLESHNSKQCNFGPCKKCGYKHNTLLHIDQFGDYLRQSRAVLINPPENAKNGTKDQPINEFTAIARLSNKLTNYVLLGTAVIYIYDQLGKPHECRALLDSCSQAHLITTNFCKKLGLPMHKPTTTLSGIEQGKAELKGQVTVRLKSRTTEFSKIFTCVVLDTIDNEIPSQQMSTAEIEVPIGIELADPKFDQSGPVDVLIGAAFFYELLCIGQIRLKPDQPLFQKTLLGWIAVGAMSFPVQFTNSKCNLIHNADLNNQLERFWIIENSLETPLSKLTKNDPAEKHFLKTVARDETGKFIVSIPIKQNKIAELGLSRDMALKRLTSLEKKLSKNPDQRKQYVDFMNEYQQLGHMSEILADSIDENMLHYYLPHHAVFKEGSTTTKIRVVFDGSAPTSTGISVNDLQYIGTPVQDDLFSIILRFRMHKYIISADVAKMYRQILVKKHDRSIQRILWRADPKTPIKTYELNTVTYGTASAPFLATRCLNELGELNKQQYPEASKIIQQDFYVDDLLSGADTIDEAIQIKNDVNTILLSAGMELRKWASNEPHIINKDNNISGDIVNLHGDKDPKTLGLNWDPCSDTLKYVVRPFKAKRITKRTILSTIAQIYDPLGLVGPAIIPAKIIMQKLWSLDLDWDESLPQTLHTLWEDICKEIFEINNLVIDRHVLLIKATKVEYHGFCDASELAYGACIYVCSIDNVGNRSTRLLCAKSRVAPLKNTTIPRLELLGAQLLAQLSQRVSLACEIPNNTWHYWTDSMVVLAWIKAPSNRWKTYVANRVAKIQELTNDNWNHVPTGNNPADVISRGIDAKELRDTDLWWNGPEWLRQDISLWPSSNETTISEIPEKKIRTFLLRQINEAKSPLFSVNSEYFDRFSSLIRIRRVTAYIYRFFTNSKNSYLERKRDNLEEKQSFRLKCIRGPLNSREVENAMTCLIKLAQTESFPNEIHKLGKGKTLPKESKLNQLNPFLDTLGILRVGGRLLNAPIPYNKQVG